MAFLELFLWVALIIQRGPSVSSRPATSSRYTQGPRQGSVAPLASVRHRRGAEIRLGKSPMRDAKPVRGVGRFNGRNPVVRKDARHNR